MTSKLTDIDQGIGPQPPPEEPNTASIIEGRVQAIVTDLQQAGFLTRERVGRRNRYELHLDQHFHEAGLPVGLLIAIFTRHDLGPHSDRPSSAE
ncbi:hypothetical protein GCM10009525_66470 [Streptosporangium amethystogenes subsp. fukuiense]|uniref:hypothetical protein n=1 Tax=Streptosporangium amethystogenes TaxID=2002 RepID=UPI0031E43A99